MSEQKQNLLDDLITFLENEKEMYGPFSVNPIEQSNHSENPSPEALTFDSGDDTDTEKETINVHESVVEKEESPMKPLTLEDRLNGCNTLEELKELCQAAEQLTTDLDGTNLVFGVGNTDADLMVIGEAPGYNEDQQGEPFVGAAGQLLNKILKAINFDRKDIYIANILKHRPPDNRNPTSEERERSLPFLERQIDLIKPKIILCVGKVSGTTLLGKDDALKNMRGKFHDYRGSKLTVTYHPAALLRNPKWKRPVWEDVQQVRSMYDKLDGSP